MTGSIAAPEHLIERSQQQAGSSDFGPNGWQVGLERFIEAVTDDLGDNAAVAARVEGIAVSRLTTRLRIEEWYAENSATVPPVEGPIVIVGLPRSGTTALHHLLAVDPQFRSPRSWELGDPIPPPVLELESEDPRRPRGTGNFSNVRHISSVDGPTEDNPIYGLHFHAQELGLPVPTYTRWWRTADQTSALAYHERVLRLLHSHRPPYKWLLKAPSYVFFLASLANQYPQARFLMTHRHPAATIPSTCSTVLDARQLILPDWVTDPEILGPELLEHLAEGAEQSLHDRAQLDEDHFFDIAQRDVEADPIGIVEQIYEFLELELTAEVRAAMMQWAADNRRGSRGIHEYAAEDYGLSEEQISDAFRGYLDRFGDLAI